MIIPHICFTCGKPISDRWQEYTHTVSLYKKEKRQFGEKTIEEQVLNELGMNRYCCRRMYLCQPKHLVDMLKNRKMN